MQKTLSISILSGKGGVGKSNLALNLGFALQQKGKRVLLMDCDMGLANIDVLLGLTPKYHLQDMLLSNLPPQKVLVKLAEGYDLLPANSGLLKFADIDNDTAETLRQKINPLAAGYDYVFLDLGAGIAPTVLTFGAMTALRAVVITPEPTSLTDSYALIKVLSYKYGIKDFSVLVNQVESREEAKKTFDRINAACERFLEFSPHNLGEIRLDRFVTEAVRKQGPFVELFPHAPASIDCHKVADTLQTLRGPWLPGDEEDEALRKVLEI